MRGIILAILVFGILIFGCTGSGTTNVKTDNSVNPGGNHGTPSGNKTPTDNSPPPKNDVSANVSVVTDTSQGLAGLGYAQLIALGVPIQCDVTSTYKGVTTKMHFYINGKSSMRVEIPNAGQSCGNSVMIMQDKKIYTSCSGSQLMPGCDWLSFESNASAQGGAGGAVNTGASETPDFTDVPATQFNCEPWVYDSSKFATSGKVCSLSDIMKNLPGGGDVNTG